MRSSSRTGMVKYTKALSGSGLCRVAAGNVVGAAASTSVRAPVSGPGPSKGYYTGAQKRIRGARPVGRRRRIRRAGSLRTRLLSPHLGSRGVPLAGVPPASDEWQEDEQENAVRRAFSEGSRFPGGSGGRARRGRWTGDAAAGPGRFHSGPTPGLSSVGLVERLSMILLCRRRCTAETFQSLGAHSHRHETGRAEGNAEVVVQGSVTQLAALHEPSRLPGKRPNRAGSCARTAPRLGGLEGMREVGTRRDLRGPGSLTNVEAQGPAAEAKAGAPRGGGGGRAFGLVLAVLSGGSPGAEYLFQKFTRAGPDSDLAQAPFAHGENPALVGQKPIAHFTPHPRLHLPFVPSRASWCKNRAA